jgi:hypothetical protein
VVIDCTASPLELIDVSCAACQPPERIIDRANDRPLVLLTLGQGQQWNDAELRITMRWPAAGASEALPVLVAPELLPRLMRPPLAPDRSDGILQPRIHLSAVLQASGRWGGLGARFSDDHDLLEDLLQVVMLPEGQGIESTMSDARALLGGDFVRRLSTKERVAIIEQAHRITSFLAQELGLLPGIRPVVLLDENPDRLNVPVGACVAAHPSWYGLSPGPPRGISVARALAGAWWGAGCRVEGPGAGALVVGIGSAMAVRWLEAVGQRREAAGVRSGYRSVLANAPSATAQRGSAAGLDARAACAIALTFDEILRSSSGAAALRGVTRQFWGRCVSAAVVQRAFTERGIEIQAGVG